MPKNRQSSGFGFGSIADRKYLDPEVKAVQAKRNPENTQMAQCNDTLNFIENELGVQGAIQFGGCLRDAKRAEATGIDIEIQDFDFVCGAHDGINNRADLIERLNALNEAGDIENLKIASDKENPKNDGEIIAAFAFDQDGRHFDLKVVLGPVHSKDMAVYGDSALNSIARGSDRVIYQHPNTDYDVENGRYQCRMAEAGEIDISKARHASLSQREGYKDENKLFFLHSIKPTEPANTPSPSGRKTLTLKRKPS